MSDQQQDRPARQERQAPARGYMGRPEKQRNAQAPNLWKGKPAQPPRAEKLSPRNAPAQLPSPSRLHDISHVKVTEVSPAEGSVFASGISVREVSPRLEFTPSTPAIIDISRQTFAEMITDDSNLSKSLLPEYLDYYTTSMLWLRILSLKQKNSQPLIEQEQDILQLVQTTPFTVPEPIFLQLRQIGNIVTSTKQHLYPAFPELPTYQFNHRGGYYGELVVPNPETDDNIHNLYEEIPCLGVLTEAVRASIGNAGPGNYQSAVSYRGLQPNRNLLGFRPLGSRRLEPKNLAFECDITDVNFPSYPEHTGFNFRFLTSISDVLANSKTFKNTEVVFSTLTEVGAQSQTVISRPIPLPGNLSLSGEQNVTSLCQESISVYGSATFFNSQLIKTSVSDNNHTNWCVITPDNDTPIPPEWIENRNNRRNLPEPYLARVFTTVSQQAEAFRINTIKTLVLTKR
ncbi:unnamed protein product [Macrosiphum euphorbiae]|uniref:Capsid protein n=1 Tax=Macrosiphum euphorbiae TaxID=13131 RepID=A0AAV0Y284_9HEMI|nr:unnamed protein product [Macrosiphum euphorbiae]